MQTFIVQLHEPHERCTDDQIPFTISALDEPTGTLSIRTEISGDLGTFLDVMARVWKFWKDEHADIRVPFSSDVIIHREMEAAVKYTIVPDQG